MKSDLYRLMQHQNVELSNNSWTNYRKVLGSLLKEYDHVPELKPLSGYLRNNDVARLVEHADYLAGQSYPSATLHFVANQFASLIKKYPFPSELNPFDPEKEARRKFLLSEAKCASVNKYLSCHFDTSLEYHLHNMRSFIRYVIGDGPRLSGIYDECDVGPGASIGTNGNATNIYRKFGGQWSVSPGAFHYAYASITQDWNLLRTLVGAHEGKVFCLDPTELRSKFTERVNVVDYNKIAFVPKTVKTHRAIAVEPLLNTWLQKGVDKFMRRRLLRIGIDLSDQSINSKMAREGSLCSDDPFVTIDLSSASDSISIELCRQILPPDWFAFLDAIRSKNYLWDGVVRPYSKFCSMGNGFCFPLETLVFVAVAHACGAKSPGHDFHVYGDDIIVRSSIASDVIALLRRLGFETNTDKTFLQGPFRESCGTDWYSGQDVRPFVLDFAFDSVENIFKWLNLTCRSSRTEMFFSNVRQFMTALLDSRLQLYRPLDGPADTGITLRSLDPPNPPSISRKGMFWSWYEIKNRPYRDTIDMSLLPASTLATMAIIRGSSSDNIFPLRRKTRTTFARCYGG